MSCRYRRWWSPPGRDLGQWFKHEGEEYNSTIEHRWQLAGDEAAQLIAVSAVAGRRTSHSAATVGNPAR
jgi:hypothetical protein